MPTRSPGAAPPMEPLTGTMKQPQSYGDAFGAPTLALRQLATDPIVITDGTWAEGTLTLTKTGAFATYVFVIGDTIAVVAGTGVNAGIFTVASRTSTRTVPVNNLSLR